MQLLFATGGHKQTQTPPPVGEGGRKEPWRDGHRLVLGRSSRATGQVIDSPGRQAGEVRSHGQSLGACRAGGFGGQNTAFPAGATLGPRLGPIPRSRHLTGRSPGGHCGRSLGGRPSRPPRAAAQSPRRAWYSVRCAAAAERRAFWASRLLLLSSPPPPRGEWTEQPQANGTCPTATVPLGGGRWRVPAPVLPAGATARCLITTTTTTVGHPLSLRLHAHPPPPILGAPSSIPGPGATPPPPCSSQSRDSLPPQPDDSHMCRDAWCHISVSLPLAWQPGART
ncbi:hypothetical protein PCL_03144 [Purpureocillium lilacinum]|uniref:Uncharacterized protein n=1 Tax=Purpureocillium lilacinum TaxID=33203 RepID=A0A2U3DYT0_PURLI|nr:hypothetical protein PCL_03144 [Purpureocillium lilacinum]